MRLTKSEKEIFDLPPKIEGPSVWHGSTMGLKRDWIEQLSDAEIAEIERATCRLAESEIEIPAIRRDDFLLPALGLRLQRILKEVLDGRGFVLLRRLPVERWTRREVAIAFFGLGAHLGNARSQNAQGHVSPAPPWSPARHDGDRCRKSISARRDARAIPPRSSRSQGHPSSVTR